MSTRREVKPRLVESAALSKNFLLRVTTPGYAATVVIDGDTGGATTVAPQLLFMRGWPESRVREFCKIRGWRVEVTQ